ncbi:MAG TPA: SDR family oxidoreductase [Pseudomonadales bacterium]|nr:SDR family oxidoreductase [Pseudomonadales bacterium]
MTDLNEGRLAGRIALITGGSSGIGRACAMRYAQEGAEIVIADRDARRGAEAVAEIRAAGNQRALFVEVDVAREDSVDAMVAAAVAEFGRIDTVLAAAGISNATYESGVTRDRDADLEARHLINLPLADWQRVLDVNLTGVMLTDRAVARAMIATGVRGTIVNIASTAARVALLGAADYCVSKAGVAMLTHVLAMELTSHGIRVNAIGPGFIETPMTQALQDDPEGRDMMIGMTPLGRLGTPLEMANAALHLACDESSYTTGQTLYPNGGMYVG